MEGAQTTFAEDVHIEPSVGRVLGFEEALWTVQGGAEALPYKVDAGESVLLICDVFSMSEQDYRGLNSSAGSLSVFPGQLITVRSGKKPLLSVCNVIVSKQTKDLPYATKTVSDSTLMKGTSAVKQAGAAGAAECTTTVTYIDGVETARTTGEFVTIREPVDRIVGQGTKRPSDYSSAPSFAWPLTGTLSSPFGPRWGRMHYGIDLAVPTGTNVKAAAGGTVLRAFNNGGYGLFVEIDHGNGWITRYGHNSKLLVKAGDKVSRGTSIAKSGNTGDSTGPHLHFEIRKSGTAVNPLYYLP
jgi:murein DD-endopeptidase MepM/ murein hydrolase activator NlpD